MRSVFLVSALAILFHGASAFPTSPAKAEPVNAADVDSQPITPRDASPDDSWEPDLNIKLARGATPAPAIEPIGAGRGGYQAVPEPSAAAARRRSIDGGLTGAGRGGYQAVPQASASASAVAGKL